MERRPPEPSILTVQSWVCASPGTLGNSSNRLNQTRRPSPLSATRLYPAGEYPAGVTVLTLGSTFGPAMSCSLPRWMITAAVNPAGGFNCFWEMPFRQGATITVENLSPDEVENFYYEIDYTLTDVPDDRAYFHAQWRRSNPLPYMEVYTLLDGVRGHGQYVGTYIAWGVNNDLWWSEGEVKVYLDGDSDWPTMCGTGLEDYFGAAWTFEQPKGQYGSYSTAFMGLPQVIKSEDSVLSQRRFGMYRWHVMDPIRFQHDIQVTVQALGLLENNQPRYLPTQDDIASTAFWYQTEPHAAFPVLPDLDYLEVVW